MYINNQTLLEQLADNDESALLESFNKISDGCSKHKYFRDYKSLRDDIKQEMLMAMWNSRRKFDHNVSDNPFSYFSTIAIRAGLSLIAKERIQTNILSYLLNTLEEGKLNDF